MGPPAWVSTPTNCSYTTASHDGTSDVEDYVAGVAMSRLENFNNPPESLLASVASAPLQAITWLMLEAACHTCPEYKNLHHTVQKGAPELSKDWDPSLLPYYRHRHLLTTLGPVVLLNDRPVVPKALRPRAVDHFHSGHPGLSTMCQRLSSSLYWPDYKQDLTNAKLSCTTCMTIAPSNPAMPPQPPVAPEYPFQSIVCDFFTLSGHTYAALADRYSNWLSILSLKRDTSEELINALRNYFSTFGIAEIFTSDGASIFTSSLFSDFCTRWGIKQRISSAYHARSNKRAEVAVKSAKRMVRDSLGPGGSLDTDALARALLAHRNTPDAVTGLSPAQVIFGRVLRDFLPCSPNKYLPRTEWRINADQRELAHAKRHVKTEEKLASGSKQLPSLIVGDCVSVQDQSGNTPRRWSKTGIVLEVSGPDSYLIKIHGSNRITKRNRQFLRKIQPFKADVDQDICLSPTLPVEPIISDQPTDDYVDPVDIHIAQPDSDQVALSDGEHRGPGVSHDIPQTTPNLSNKKPSTLPRHLRERWFVNPNYPSLPPAPVRDDTVNIPNLAPMLSNLPGSPGFPCQPPLPLTQYHAQYQPTPPGYLPAYPTSPPYLPPSPPGVYQSAGREDLNKLSTYLAYLTNTAQSSSGEGGIQSYQTQQI